MLQAIGLLVQCAEAKRALLDDPFPCLQKRWILVGSGITGLDSGMALGLLLKTNKHEEGMG